MKCSYLKHHLNIKEKQYKPAFRAVSIMSWSTSSPKYMKSTVVSLCGFVRLEYNFLLSNLGLGRGPPSLAARKADTSMKKFKILRNILSEELFKI